MKADEFVLRLKALAPAKPVLLGCGYGNDEALAFIESFVCQSRAVPLSIASKGDSMLELLTKWDLSAVEIGPISFHSEPEALGNHLEIGTVEGDRLVYRLDAKDYVLLDSQNVQHVMCKAAPNGDALLNGLLEVASYYSKTAVEEIDIDDTSVGAEFKKKCVQAFGGSEYESFCTSILGV
jgi:hypothetical protein